MGFRKIFLILFFLVVMGGGAHASVSLGSYPTEKAILVDYEYGSTLPQIAYLVNNESIMRIDGNVCYINGYLRMRYNSYLYINDTSVSDVRINNSIGTIGLYEGKYYIENVTLSSWNNNESRYPNVLESQETISVNGGYLRNCTLRSIGSTGLNYITMDVHDLYLYNCSYGIAPYKSSNINIYNISSEHSARSAIELKNCSYLNVYNCSVWDAGSGSGHHGLAGFNTSNSVIHDIYINKTGWSSLDFTENGGVASDNITIYNVTIKNTGHNGIDLHSASNIRISNASIYAPSYLSTNGIMVTGAVLTGGDFKTHDIYLDHIYTYNSFPGVGVILTNVGNISVSDHISTNDSAGVSGLNTKNVTARNITIYNSRNGFLLGYSSDSPGYNLESMIFDSNLFAATTWSASVDCSKNTLLTNILYNPARIRIGTGDGGNADGRVLYYGDFVVVNSSNSVLSGTISLTNQTGDYAGTDAAGTNQSDFSFDGRTPLPLDRGNSISIPDYYESTLTNIQYSTVADITTDAGNVQLDNIVPDYRWYRTNTTNSKYTITAIINNSANTHFTGYAPSPGYNNYEVGDSVKFQIWGSEPLTSVSWKKDNVTVQTGGMTYDAIIGETPITVDILGESANGSVSKTWVVDPNHIIDPDPEGIAPVANFTANTTNTTYPAWVSFTDSSTETPTFWQWDFDNDGHVDSTSQNATCKYKVKGNYTVKLTVSNGAGTNFKTQESYIQITGATPDRRHFYVSFSDWFNTFIRQYFGGV